ncbi:3-deoxy-manno-octulosonate cytidylyltransferase [Exilibacterium tricleocarpae]|uniref:3-deoxy-manno-octulosonate cytidylyltransferase n=1 Tax=Exilibacterium tricleocarpae TaxID=2591008 RepID=A0A545TVT9_9GAMM|nr:3-deoxy-manno-octulosonate cytidylyltransferase [Exilibacterium tricleocarpae]TQV81324.1 3-deoxy-manno-octulosonate cytidylyltransferase [Exilibacterium tricleocarpae]
MKFYIVIPARYASSRLPGKPLKEIAGKPMIQHVYERAQQCAAERVIVATDDERIKAAVEGFGGEAVMTAATHASGTDRLYEVAQALNFLPSDIVVNVQGDEPLIPPAVIDQVAGLLARCDGASVATLSESITRLDDFLDPGVVKVVTDAQEHALYFSRAPIPWPRDGFAADKTRLPDSLNARRHIGIYAYRVELLNRFVSWPLAPLEATESLEQLRVLWNGEKIKVALAAASVPGGIDTAADLQRVQRLLAP